MTNLQKCLASFGMLLWACAAPALAESSVASSASDSVSTSVGSISGSIKNSSDSSSRDKDVAAGDYKVIEMAAVAERPGIVRMKLQAVHDATGEGEFFLYVPQEAIDQGRVATGRIVTAHARPYGVEFASEATNKAFFLVLADDWYRELKTNPVL